jgi:hypothetical protein
MTIKNVTEKQLDDTLEAVNLKYQNNVKMTKEPLNESRTRWRIRLFVKDSKGPGHRLGYGTFAFGKKKRLPNACWHVHGTFFDLLPSCAIIRARNLVIHPGDRWNDFNIGSKIVPLYFSDACECNGEVEAQDQVGEYFGRA